MKASYHCLVIYREHCYRITQDRRRRVHAQTGTTYIGRYNDNIDILKTARNYNCRLILRVKSK